MNRRLKARLQLAVFGRTAAVPAKKRKRVSQVSLAAELGVSQALVSQVLNGARQYCSDGLYRKIWQLATTRGYEARGIQPSANPLRSGNPRSRRSGSVS
jgi:DNA-binding LacI/PurR family transcriptional regulator